MNFNRDVCGLFTSLAFDRLNGCYANLSGGTQGEAMEDITGGLVESIDLTKIGSEDLYKDLHKYVQRCCLMGCSITVGLYLNPISRSGGVWNLILICQMFILF